MSAQWTKFYSLLADQLGKFSPEELFAKIKALPDGKDFLGYFHFDNYELWQERGQKLDPFSVMAIFNRGQTEAHRARIATLLGQEFSVKAAAPECFHGIPYVDPRRSIFAGDAQMWALYNACLSGPESPGFAQAWDDAKDVRGNALGNLSIALFWARPESFMAVDRISEPRIQELTGLKIPHDKCSGAEYAQFVIELKKKLAGKSFAELAYAAWREAHPGGGCGE